MNLQSFSSPNFFSPQNKISTNIDSNFPLLTANKISTTADTQFKDLNEKSKEEIINIYNKSKKPMIDGIDYLKNSSIYELDEIENSLKKIKIGVNNLNSKQEILMNKLIKLRETQKADTIHTEKYCVSGLLKYQRKEFDRNENLPIDLFKSFRDQIESKVENFDNNFKNFSLQLDSANNYLNIDAQNMLLGNYGENNNLDPKKILEIIQIQNQIFFNIASKIALIHEKTEQAKIKFKSKYFSYSSDDDPFEDDKRKQIEIKKKFENEAKRKLALDTSNSFPNQQVNSTNIGSGFGSLQPASATGLAFGASQPASTTGSFGFGSSQPASNTGFNIQNSTTFGSSSFGSNILGGSNMAGDLIKTVPKKEKNKSR